MGKNKIGQSIDVEQELDSRKKWADELREQERTTSYLCKRCSFCRR